MNNIIAKKCCHAFVFSWKKVKSHCKFSYQQLIALWFIHKSCARAWIIFYEGKITINVKITHAFPLYPEKFVKGVPQHLKNYQRCARPLHAVSNAGKLSWVCMWKYFRFSHFETAGKSIMVQKYYPTDVSVSTLFSRGWTAIPLMLNFHFQNCPFFRLVMNIIAFLSLLRVDSDPTRSLHVVFVELNFIQPTHKQ